MRRPGYGGQVVANLAVLVSLSQYCSFHWQADFLTFLMISHKFITNPCSKTIKIDKMRRPGYGGQVVGKSSCPSVAFLILTNSLSDGFLDFPNDFAQVHYKSLLKNYQH